MIPNLLKSSLSYLLFLVLASSCASDAGPDEGNSGSNRLDFDPDNASIALPAGFQAVLVADNLGQARHLCVDASGDVYVNLGSERMGSGLVALRDTTGDGRADQVKYFGSGGGTAILLKDTYLYYTTNTQVFRYALDPESLVPSGNPELMLTLPAQSQHAAKALAFDQSGNMYVSIGAPSNACQDPSRTAGVPGQDPCPLLNNAGGVWQFSATTPNQVQADGIRYATGIRHIVGMDWSDDANMLFAMQHGRDQLHQLWPDLYTEEQSAELPAEEMLAIEQGDNFGWPYCYYDQQQAQKLLAPEYGGNGSQVGRCDQYEDPVIAFPGHWAPNSLKFYKGNNFPTSYHGGAFVAFHGSWNRAPFPQQGYKVVFVPFSNGMPAGSYEDFATEFAGDGSEINSPGQAEYRPCGLAFGPDGSLYVCDSSQGRVWRIVYTGK